MKCPTCGQHTPDSWQSLFPKPFGMGPDASTLEGPSPHNEVVRLYWMKCANPKCKELVIHTVEGYEVDGGAIQTTASYLVRPRYAQRPLDELIQGHYRTDFEEAAAILQASPRMSAVLSRRILADLLEDYAQLDDFRLVDRIDKFIDDTSRPTELRENLHYLREIADLSAHTKKNDQAEIVTADADEAEWTLGIIERLFDHFIVAPEKNKKFRERVDQKLAETGRKPIDPLPDTQPKGGLPSGDAA